MPPKLSKKEQEEIARLEEEKKQKEEEERLKKEAEERKKYEPATLNTGLVCVLTNYYVGEIVKVLNPREFTANYIENYLVNQKIRKNFRDIDIQTLVEFTLNNIHFAIENQFDRNELYIFINIMWHILMTGNPRLIPFREQEKNECEKDYELNIKKHISSQKVDKNSKSDLQYLQNLLEKHSSNASETHQQVFTPQALILILNYVKYSYFAHYSLYQFVALNDQQNLDVFETIFIDEPQPIIDGLNDAIYEPLDNHKNEDKLQQENSQQENENQDEEQQEGEDEGEEEEELDPISQQIVQQKIREAQQNIEQQLEERQLQHKTRIEELSQPKKKK